MQLLADTFASLFLCFEKCRRKKRPQENPICFKHRMGTNCFSSWEKHFLHSFVQIHSRAQAVRSPIARDVGPAEPRAHFWWLAAPLWDGSFRGKDRKHTQSLTVSVQLSSLYKKGKQDKRFNESPKATKQSWKKPVSHLGQQQSKSVSKAIYCKQFFLENCQKWGVFLWCDLLPIPATILVGSFLSGWLRLVTACIPSLIFPYIVFLALAQNHRGTAWKILKHVFIHQRTAEHFILLLKHGRLKGKDCSSPIICCFEP